MPKLTPADEKFLRSVGISAEPITSFAEEIANLQKRARLDLLTEITLQRLLKEFRLSAEDNE